MSLVFAVLEARARAATSPRGEASLHVGTDEVLVSRTSDGYRAAAAGLFAEPGPSVERVQRLLDGLPDSVFDAPVEGP